MGIVDTIGSVFNPFHRLVEPMASTLATLPRDVVLRSGQRVPFDAERIRAALASAGQASGEYGAEEAALLTAQVTKVLIHRFQGEAPTIEQIQDVAEQTLIAANHLATARAYIVYREQHATLRADRQTLVDVESSINEYLTRADWRGDAKANQGYSLGGLILNVAGKVTANYWLSHVYTPEIGEAHRSGDLHIHDLDMLSGYCAGWSLRTLLHEGLNGVPGKVEAGPPQHMSSAVGQIVNFLGTLQNEWAGAQAFSSFDTYMAPFVRKDGMDYAQVRQCIQELVYNLNVMTTGDAKGRVFTFPIPTYNITKDFPWESENAQLLFEMTAKYGLPYFQNFINSELEPNMVRSMCCRLQLDLRELLKRGNGLFGSAEQTGSLGVVTINCARLGYLHAGDEAGLFAALDRLLELGKQSLETKRKLIQRLMDQGLFPYTKRYLGTLRNHFSTLGVNGINEMVRNFTADQHDITSEWGHAFALRLLDHVRERMTAFQEETGHLYNLEATPAEGTTYRFAKEDKKRWPAILQAGTSEQPYYTNSSQLPVGFTDDPFEALMRQEALQGKYTGGTVLHLYMGERVSSGVACRELVRRALTNFRLPYITVTPTFSICPTHGYLAGEHPFCPRCDEERLDAKRRRLAA